MVSITVKSIEVSTFFRLNHDNAYRRGWPFFSTIAHSFVDHCSLLFIIRQRT